MRVVDAEYKLQKNIKIAMLYLEDDDAVNAETFIKKAATLITGTKVLPLAFVTLSCLPVSDAFHALYKCYFMRTALTLHAQNTR